MYLFILVKGTSDYPSNLFLSQSVPSSLIEGITRQSDKQRESQEMRRGIPTSNTNHSSYTHTSLQKHVRTSICIHTQMHIRKYIWVCGVSAVFSWFSCLFRRARDWKVACNFPQLCAEDRTAYSVSIIVILRTHCSSGNSALYNYMTQWDLSLCFGCSIITLIQSLY